MQFTTRSLLILTVVVAAPFGAVAIGNAIWTNHCRSLEPSLFTHVFESELDQVRQAIEARESSGLGGGPLPRDTPDRIFFAIGRSEVDGTWVAPGRKLLERMDAANVSSVSQREGNDPVYLLRNIRWTGWNTVQLDKEQFQGDIHSAMRNMKLIRVAGQWSVVEEGEYWADESVSRPFGHSNSGSPF